MGAQARLDVGDLDLGVVGGERRGHGGGGVALHHHPVGPDLVEDRLQGLQGQGAEAGERLVGPHHVQVMVGADVEEAEHLVEDMPVLAGDADDRLEVRGSLQGVHHRRHLYRLGAGAEHRQDFLHQDCAAPSSSTPAATPSARVATCSPRRCVLAPKDDSQMGVGCEGWPASLRE